MQKIYDKNIGSTFLSTTGTTKLFGRILKAESMA